MSIEKFEAVLAAGKYSQAEQTSVPAWFLRFREFLCEHDLLPADVDQSIVIRFLQRVKAQGTPRKKGQDYLLGFAPPVYWYVGEP